MSEKITKQNEIIIELLVNMSKKVDEIHEFLFDIGGDDSDNSVVGEQEKTIKAKSNIEHMFSTENTVKKHKQ
ncbi:MAG: hypothetical protein ACK5LP_10330 [Campylobacteraceae bacterium]